LHSFQEEVFVFCSAYRILWFAFLNKKTIFAHSKIFENHK